MSIIGGDLRIVYLARMLSEDGYNVYTYGLEKQEILKNVENVFMCTDEKECTNKSNVIISSVPICEDKENIKAPYSKKSIKIKDIEKLLTNKTFFAGSIPKNFGMTDKSNIIDIMKCEELAVLNSISTAEGAIQIAMEETNHTLHDSNILILGFGRIGKVLAKMLNAIGANVYCEARKNEDLAWIKTYGYNVVKLSNLNENLKNKDIIINTIPSIILNEEKLKLLDKNSLVIDLASKPGGVDYEKVSNIGVKVIWALALPGKVAPYSAAKAIKKTIYNEITERNIFC